MTGPNAYWISWYSHRPRSEFELHSPWWVSGYDADDNDILIAAVRAVDEAAAWQTVRDAYDLPREESDITERFCEQLETGQSPFSDRWPQAAWMAWDDERTCACDLPVCLGRSWKSASLAESVHAMHDRAMGSPMKYRKKPRVIEAVQLRWSTWGEVVEFLERHGKSIPLDPPADYIAADEASDTCGEPGPEYISLVLTTTHGEPAVFRHGDWIIPDSTPGTFYPCKPDVFAETYEPVEE